MEEIKNIKTQNLDSLMESRLERIKDAQKRVEAAQDRVNERLGLSDQKRAQYEKAARGFEAMFVHQMIKQMKTSMLEEKDSDSTFGGNTLEGYADMLLADEISNQGTGIGIADKVFSHLTGGEKLRPVTKHFNSLEKVNTGVPIQPEKNVIDSVRDFAGNAPEAAAGGTFLERLNRRMNEYETLIDGASEEFGVPKELIKAVITAESAGRYDAVSRAGAKGLMQLMDGTAKGLGVTNSFDPYENIQGGTKYLRQMLDRFDNNLDHALSAYNAGPGNVEKYNGIPPFSETKSYLQQVKKYINYFNNEKINEQ